MYFVINMQQEKFTIRFKYLSARKSYPVSFVR